MNKCAKKENIDSANFAEKTEASAAAMSLDTQQAFEEAQRAAQHSEATTPDPKLLVGIAVSQSDVANDSCAF